MKEVTILEAEYNELMACRLMLGQISLYIEDFCKEEDTTLTGVQRILASYYSMKSNELYDVLEKNKPSSF